jgi:prefoldin subunit 5
LEIKSLEATLATLRAQAEHLKQTLLEITNDIASKQQVAE